MFKISFSINIHTSFPIVSASRLFADFRLASIYTRTYPPPSNFLRLFLSTFLLLPLIRFFLSSAILPPTPLLARTFARCLSRAVLPPLSLSLSICLVCLSFASQSTRQATSMSATARFQAVEGNWLYPAAAQRRAFTHTPFGDNPGRAARRNAPMLQLKRREKIGGAYD